MRFEATRAMANLVRQAPSPGLTAALVNAGALPAFIPLLSSTHAILVSEGTVVLVRMAGDAAHRQRMITDGSLVSVRSLLGVSPSFPHTRSSHTHTHTHAHTHTHTL